MGFETILFEAWPLAYGAAGGAVLGVLTFIENWKDGEKFDFWKFVKSLVPPLLIGGAAGILTGDPIVAFTAGITGKKLWETYSVISR